MKKYATLLSYFEKQEKIIDTLYTDLCQLDLTTDDKKYFFAKYAFAMQAQQLYTAVEDLLKQIAQTFENHIQDPSSYHKELLRRLNMAIPDIRPAVISEQTMLLLDKLRAFRHFARHAYDCELNEKELLILQKRLQSDFYLFLDDLSSFKSFVAQLSDA